MLIAFLADELRDVGGRKDSRWRVWDTAHSRRAIEDRITGSPGAVYRIGSASRARVSRPCWCWPMNRRTQWPETTGERMVAALQVPRRVSNRIRASSRSARGRPIRNTGLAKTVGRRCGLRADRTRPTADDPKFRTRTWAQGKPESMKYHTRSRDRDPHRNQTSKTGSGAARRVRCAAAESRHARC